LRCRSVPKCCRAGVARTGEPRLVEPPRPSPPPPFVGQRRVIDYLKRVGSGGLAPAYLFHGQRGVGKRTFATILAMTLHCERPVSFPTGYCGTCGPCRRAIAGSSGDTIVISDEFIREADRLAGKSIERKTDVMGIETSRRIIQLMQLHSYEGGRLICIVPDFDFVTNDTVYNALLKELEEPNPGRLFLLTAERPDRVLPTIRSRTTSLRFDALSEDEIAAQLTSHYHVPSARARMFARRAQGSLGDALAELDGEDVDLRGAARAWALACVRAPRAIPQAPQLAKESARDDIVEVLRCARLAMRDALMVALGSGAQVLDRESAEDYETTVAALGPQAPARLIGALGAVNEASRIADETNIPPANVLGWLQVQLRSV
jgi:DNA polymerase III subunit delta'